MDYKEYARQMRENCVKDDNGNIVCSAELWEQIASVIENAPTAKTFAKHFLENNIIVLPYDLKLPENLWSIMFEVDFGEHIFYGEWNEKVGDLNERL